MTTYFTAPDGHDEPTLWVHTGVPDLPQPVLRRVDLGIGMAHHWDELVARVIAGNPDRDELTETFVRTLRRALPGVPICAATDIEWGTPVAAWEQTHYSRQELCNGVGCIQDAGHDGLCHELGEGT